MLEISERERERLTTHRDPAAIGIVLMKSKPVTKVLNFMQLVI